MVQKKVNTFLLLYKCVSISKSYSMLLLYHVSLKNKKKQTPQKKKYYGTKILSVVSVSI